MGSTNVGTSYENKVPGDQHTASPLDDACFSDFKAARSDHIAETFDVERGDPLKFSMATPALGESCFRRVWQVAPVPERIIQDLDRWPKSIQAIVDNQGMLVEKQKASGHRRSRGYRGRMHIDAANALEQSDAKFGAL